MICQLCGCEQPDNQRECRQCHTPLERRVKSRNFDLEKTGEKTQRLVRVERRRPRGQEKSKTKQPDAVSSHKTQVERSNPSREELDQLEAAIAKLRRYAEPVEHAEPEPKTEQESVSPDDHIVEFKRRVAQRQGGGQKPGGEPERDVSLSDGREEADRVEKSVSPARSVSDRAKDEPEQELTPSAVEAVAQRREPHPVAEPLAKAGSRDSSSKGGSTPSRQTKLDQLVERLKRVALTTTPMFQGRSIEAYLGVVSAGAVVKLDQWAGYFDELEDVGALRYAPFFDRLRKARDMVMTDLKIEATKLGANGVVGVTVQFEPTTRGGESSRLVWMVATGTAIVMEEEGERSGTSG